MKKTCENCHRFSEYCGSNPLVWDDLKHMSGSPVWMQYPVREGVTDNSRWVLVHGSAFVDEDGNEHPIGKLREDGVRFFRQKPFGKNRCEICRFYRKEKDEFFWQCKNGKSPHAGEYTPTVSGCEEWEEIHENDT